MLRNDRYLQFCSAPSCLKKRAGRGGGRLPEERRRLTEVNILHMSLIIYFSLKIHPLTTELKQAALFPNIAFLL